MKTPFAFSELLIFDENASNERAAAQGQLQYRFSSVAVLQDPEDAIQHASAMDTNTDCVILIVKDFHCAHGNGFLSFKSAHPGVEQMFWSIGLMGLGVVVLTEEMLTQEFTHFFALFDAETHVPLPVQPPAGILWEYFCNNLKTHPEVYFSKHWRRVCRRVRRASGF